MHSARAPGCPDTEPTVQELLPGTFLSSHGVYGRERGMQGCCRHSVHHISFSTSSFHSQVCHCHTDKRISHFKTSFHLYDHTVLKVCIKSPFGLLVVLVCENLWFHRESVPGLTQAGHGSCSELSVASPGEVSLRPRRFTQRPCVLDSCSGSLAGSRGQ